MIGVALTSSARSLRTTRSLGSLRAAVASPSASSVPPLPTRSLVSTVLLTRETYDKRNVTQLKDECKQRGLTTGGRRADIVARLLNDDARQNGSGLREEPVPAKAKAHRRTNSSLASLRGGDAKAQSSKGSAKSSPSSTPSPNDSNSTARHPVGPSHTVTGEGASIPQPENIKPGQVAHAGQPLGQGQPAISTKEKMDPDSNPPGVPPQKEPSHHPTTFKVEVPVEMVKEEHGPEIPIVTMYTRREEEVPAPRGPKLVTASDTSDVSHAFDATHHEGSAPNAAAQAIESAARSFKADAGLKGSTLGPQVSSVLKATGLAEVGQKASEAAAAVVEDASKVFGQVKAAASSEGGVGAGSFAGSGAGAGSAKRPLNADEKRGVYALGAILFGGLFAGSLGAPAKKKGGEHH